MLFDATMMACCLDEIRRVALGATIRDCHQTRRLAFYIELDVRSPLRFIAVSAEADLARIHLSGPPKPSSRASFPFVLFARKHLRGARVWSVEQVGFDRIARIRLENRNPGIPDPARSLVVETMGKHSNAILLNNADQVLEAIKHVTADVSSVRPILPHADYALPPTTRGRDPRSASVDELATGFAEAGYVPVGRLLCTWFDGVSRTLAEEACHRAAVSMDAVGTALSEAEIERLATEFLELMRLIADGQWEPMAYAEGSPPVYPIPLRHLGQGIHLANISGPLSDLVEQRRAATELARHRTTALASIEAARRRLEGRLAVLVRQADPEPAREARRCAEALAASLSAVVPGSPQVDLPDPYDPEGPPIRVSLDPARSPADNLTRLFDRARRLRRAAEVSPALEARVRADLASLEYSEQAVRAARTVAEVERAYGAAQRRGLCGAAPRPRSGGETDFPSRPSSDGYELLYGRNAEESDRLLREVAAADDWWLHARDQRGGHVIVRTAKRPEAVPRRTLEEAARLAAFLSKSRHSSLVPVDYTLRKYVRKARRSAPGLHVYEREKTIMVRPLADADEPF